MSNLSVASNKKNRTSVRRSGFLRRKQKVKMNRQNSSLRGLQSMLPWAIHTACFDKELAKSHEVLEVVACNLFIAFGDCKSSLFQEWFWKLSRSICNKFCYRGRRQTISELKELSLLWRYESIGLEPEVEILHRFKEPSIPRGVLSVSEWRHRVMQASRFARALPAPDDSDRIDALKEHKRILSSDFTVKRSLVEDLRIHCRTLSRMKPAKVSFTGGSSSACYERGVADGGLNEEIRQLVDWFRSLVLPISEIHKIALSLPTSLFGGLEPIDTTHSGYQFRVRRGEDCRMDEILFLFPLGRLEIGLDDWELRRERLFALAACWHSVNWTRLPKVRRVCLLEKGWKTRVVCPLEACDLYLASGVGNVLMSVLKQTPGIKNSILGDPVRDLDWSTGRRYGIVRSLDLRSASDYLEFSVCKAVVYGILDGQRAPLWMYQVANRMLGKMTVVDSDGSVWITNRGSLMGQPLTWPILCYALHFAQTECRSKGFFAINGDDYIGSHTRETNTVLSNLITGLGLKLHPKKDFTTFNGHGVFSEELVTVGRQRFYPTASLKPFLALSKGGKPLWRNGPAVASATGKLPEMWRPRAVQVAAFTYRGTYAMLRRVGIAPTAPRFCGGGGFPGRVSGTHLRIARGLLGQKIEERFEIVSKFMSAWSETHSMVFEHATELMTKGLLEYGRAAAKEEDLRPMRDILTSYIGALSFAYNIALPPPDKRDGSITSVARKVRNGISLAMSKSFWVSTSEPARDQTALWSMEIHEPLMKIQPPLPIDLRFDVKASLDPALAPIIVSKDDV